MHLYDGYNAANVRSQMRMANSERFDLYFVMDLNTIRISRAVIEECIYSLDKETLSNVIREINKQGDIDFFIEEMNALMDKIPYDRIALIAIVIYNLAYSFEGDTNSLRFLNPINRGAWRFSEELINILKTQEERYETYRIILQECSVYSLGQVAHKINDIELAHGRLAGKMEDKKGQIISIEQLEKLEELFVERITMLFETKNVIEIEDFLFAIDVWKRLDETSANEHINSLLEDDIMKLKYVCLTAGHWTGTNGKGWYFIPEIYSEYFTDKEIKQLIDELDKKELNKFTKLEQIKLASFVLNYDKTTSYISEDEARVLVQEWKDSVK